MINKIFDRPKIISVVGSVNTGKSNLIYFFIKEVLKYNASVFCYGLKKEINKTSVFNSVQELETIQNSIIFIDEFMTLFDLDNRKQKKDIENTMRLINHNNNILVLCGVGENFKKFISSKTDIVIYKSVKYCDLINGSQIKNILLNYCGIEKGSTLLSLADDEVLLYDGKYTKHNIPYLKDCDTKIKNIKILRCAK